ncbi:MAG: Asp23/Gls24 family envelope stress response protein [Candidatus Omnitrophica bacterium]|nr:Asp23/Gls24 family envelope stress response protein [Candidatus Omnitrophota bacterium]
MSSEQTHRDRTTELGVIRINNDAIATIASLAATEVRGVYSMGGGARGRICDILCRRYSSKGVRIEMKESEVRLVVSIIVEYGMDIPRVADEVQDSVKRAVEKMTGLIMSEVDVVVEGVHAPAADNIRKGV